MRLTQLELSGFKSFADSTGLPFEDGVTAVVGPNGCGKSNISDAVRWVLGEHRARLLRSQKMDEVIFQGAAKRRPVNIAEVSLHLDNSDSSLPISYREVVITRRLSRNGQSEYLVNQVPVRLRDVQDLLKGTGLGHNAGVVIEAQMIDRLLSDRTEERRSLFEEAAGIGLYRDRKTSTERRLQKTLEDLQRLDDVIAGVQTQVRSLARQRGRAERYATYTTERFNIVMTLTRRELQEFEVARVRLAERRTELGTRIPTCREQLSALERGREERVQGRATAEAGRTEVERRLAATQVEIERLEGDLKLAAERLENAAQRKARAAEESQEARKRAAQGARESEAAANERAAAESARASVQTELDLRMATEKEARDRLAAHRTLVRETEDRLQQQAELFRALTGERTAGESELTELRSLRAEADERRSTATQELEGAGARLKETEQALVDREREDEEATNALEHARHTLAAAREHEAALRAERRGTLERIAHLGARREALEALERNREGLAPAARALLESRRQFTDDGILGPLSDFVTAPQANAQLAERLLGEWLQAVLVRDSQTVAAVQAWHARHQPGPLVILPVEPAPRAKALAEKSMADLTVSAPAEAWVRTLLADVQSLDAEGLAIRHGNGAVYLAGTTNSGPLSRRAELDVLVKQFSDAERSQQTLNLAVEQAARDFAEAETGLELATRRAEEARAVLREAQGHHDDAMRRFKRAEQEVSEAQAWVTRLDERIDDRSTRLGEVVLALTDGEGGRANLAAELENLRAQLAEHEAAQEAARERRVHWQVEEAQISAREQAARDREERASQMYGGAQSAIETLEREIQQLEADSKRLQSQRGEWQDALAERRVALQELEAASADGEASVQRAEAALQEAEQALERGRAELQELQEASHRLELEMTELEGRRRAAVERVEAEWQKPFAELLENTPDVEGNTQALKDEAERLLRAIEALGPVNALAVEEHAEESKRFTFLEEQRADLVEARNSLSAALREIDATARAMFTETFEEIRKHFHAVFQTLFQGGECDLRLTNDVDPLESDIDIFAAPRGKRVQRIHLLSSGERALVALSLLFSIYLTKPAPFCLLDEVDAPLDDANVIRFVRLLDEFKSDSQFIVITHNPRTMQVADAVYGVTMQEPGVSTIVGVRLGEMQPVAT